MNPPFPVEQVLGGLANIGIVLAGFAFAGFVLLMNHLGDLQIAESRKSADDAGTSRDDDPHFQTMYLLIGSFSAGVLAAYLLTVSRTGDPWTAYYGFQFAQATLFLETLALVAAVNRMIAVYAGPMYEKIAWFVTIAMGSFMTLLVAFEQGRAQLTSLGWTGSGLQRVGFALLVVVAAAPILAAVLAGTFLRTELRSGSLNHAPFYSGGLAMAGALLGLGHTYVRFTDAQPGGMHHLVNVAIVLIVALFAAWTLVLGRASWSPD